MKEIPRYRSKRKSKKKSKTERLLVFAWYSARQGRPVHIIAHTKGYAEDLADKIRKRLKDSGGNPALVTAGSPVAPQKMPLDTYVAIHHQVSRVIIEGPDGGEYKPTDFLRLWTEYRRHQRDGESQRKESQPEESAKYRSDKETDKRQESREP